MARCAMGPAGFMKVWVLFSSFYLLFFFFFFFFFLPRPIYVPRKEARVCSIHNESCKYKIFSPPSLFFRSFSPTQLFERKKRHFLGENFETERAKGVAVGWWGVGWGWAWGTKKEGGRGEVDRYLMFYAQSTASGHIRAKQNVLRTTTSTNSDSLLKTPVCTRTRKNNHVRTLKIL